MNKKINWGILGCGRIAGLFAEDALHLPGAILYAAASRSETKAMEFARRYGIMKAYGSYESMLKDPAVEAVYVATPHNYHFEHARMALEQGKAVLLEKPFTVNAREAGDLVNLARQKGLFLMEAMWTRFVPAIRSLHEQLAGGRLGVLRHLFADFSFTAPFDPSGRLFNAGLAGGALLDVGIYPLSFASLLFSRQPVALTAMAAMGSTGIDEQTVIQADYGEGRQAQLACSVTRVSSQRAHLSGSLGEVTVPVFWKALELQWKDPEGKLQVQSFPRETHGYNYEIQAVMEALLEGRTEHPLMPLKETLAIMETLDRVRQETGLVYPFE